MIHLNLFKPSFNLVLTENRTLRYVTFFGWYMMQGIPAGFALTALANYLAAEQMSTGEIGAFVALIGLPWGIKFIWGPIVDRYTYIPMGTRRPWIIASQILAVMTMVGILMVGNPISNFQLLSLLFFIHAIFASIQDVAVDALAIEVIPENERGKTTAFMRCGMILGTAFGAAGLGYLLRKYGFEWAALTEVLVLGGLTFFSFFVRERQEDSLLLKFSHSRSISNVEEKKTSNFWSIFPELARAIFQPASILLTLAIGIIYVTESLYRRVLNVYLIQEVGWTDLQLTSLKGVIGTLLTLSIVFIGGWLVDRFSGRHVLSTTILLLLVLFVGFTILEPIWGNNWLTGSFILIKGIMDTLVDVAAIPLFMYLARPGIEGSQFVFYMALSNQMDVLGASMAGFAIEYTSIGGLGWICAGGILISFFLVRLSNAVERKR